VPEGAVGDNPAEGDELADPGDGYPTGSRDQEDRGVDEGQNVGRLFVPLGRVRRRVEGSHDEAGPEHVGVDQAHPGPPCPWTGRSRPTLRPLEWPHGTTVTVGGGQQNVAHPWW
jgi:hypothetical protein